jgi:hypothetical protein
MKAGKRLGRKRRVIGLGYGVGMVLLVSIAPSRAADAPDATDEICGLVPGLQGRIGDIHSDPGIEAIVAVERGGKTRNVSTGCFLRQGDIVRAGRGTIVSVVLPSHQIANASFDSPVVVSASAANGRLTSILGVLRAVAGNDGAKARDVAMAKIAATRTLREPPILPGVAGTSEQRVDNGNVLYLHWEGGAPPFVVRLVPQESQTTVIELTGLSERVAHLDPRQLSGRYDLTVADRAQASEILHLRFLSDSEVPKSPDAAIADDEEARALLNAVWLLMRGPAQWQLEALSRLEYLAVERDDIVAEGIVGDQR